MPETRVTLALVRCLVYLEGVQEKFHKSSLSTRRENCNCKNRKMSASSSTLLRQKKELQLLVKGFGHFRAFRYEDKPISGENFGCVNWM